jgi:hypothetical protein
VANQEDGFILTVDNKVLVLGTVLYAYGLQVGAQINSRENNSRNVIATDN